MSGIFLFNARLGIDVPALNKEWDKYSNAEQQEILLKWEKIRGAIPDRIKELEKSIDMKQAMLSDESDFSISCRLNSEIADLASTINDLWLWYRTNEDISNKMH
ncbi:hypothetical protein [Peribacillus glennii]|uniref:Uncharacterized protein n=1 Tax=Peribacillus glennii TaxID=2303991 RepID=A0A372LI92_9BACI|nr:hypothetical protein [Peribacillus glennii]RFU65998.1 hypothetical protein D0466_09065 [Peribacillus glennii]